MLGPGRYLLGAIELLLLVGFAWIGAARVRRRWLPEVGGEAGFLASAVVAIALLIWVAELLGTISLFKPVPYLLCVAALGLVLWRFVPSAGATAPAAGARPSLIATVISLVIAGIAIGHFLSGVKLRLGTGMTGFDSTWYHGPFAAGFFQSGNTIDLHFIAPQFLAWFYPANSELLGSVGMLAFGRDLLSPMLNLGWLLGCLLGCWCIGRPFRVAPWSLALGAIALSVPALADQAGEARNDIVGIFFLLAAVAIALNAWGGTEKRLGGEEGGSGLGPYLVVGLAAGLAAGTKLNFLLPAAVLVLGSALIAPGGTRLRSFAAVALAALAGGGYWYLRNLAHSGNPLPWIHHLGPIDLPAPEQALGGREAHSVLGYLTDGKVWSDWLLPGLHGGLWFLWPLLLLASLAGLALASAQSRGSFRTDSDRKEPRDWALALAGLVGLAAALAWLVAPTSASGPDGMPRGFESGLRYLAPALILGLALLPLALSRLAPGQKVRRSLGPHRGTKVRRTLGFGVGWGVGLGAFVMLVVALGYPVQRHYLESRYKDPTFTAPGLNAAFAWSRDISGARIATTSTRQYPLFGTDLTNQVQYLGTEQPHGGFEAPATCKEFLQLLADGNYDYVVTTRDRVEPNKPPYPPSVKWTEEAGGTPILKEPPSVVFKLTKPLDPSACN